MLTEEAPILRLCRVNCQISNPHAAPMGVNFFNGVPPCGYRPELIICNRAKLSSQLCQYRRLPGS